MGERGSRPSQSLIIISRELQVGTWIGVEIPRGIRSSHYRSIWRSRPLGGIPVKRGKGGRGRPLKGHFTIAKGAFQWGVGCHGGFPLKGGKRLINCEVGSGESGHDDGVVRSPPWLCVL